MKDKLLKLLENSYSPYSNFPVACVVVTKDLKEFNGVNIEDASYRAGACAERVALFSAITAGYKKNDIKEINIMVASGKISTPCFVCRQMILELCDKNTLINCYDKDGNIKTYTVDELCPLPFNEDDLK